MTFRPTRRHVLFIFPLLFILLAAVYVLDFGRIRTAEMLEPKGAHTGADDMLSSLNVTAFGQDTKRRIWIGTSAGINVYDGQGYVQYFHDAADAAALPDDYINVIHRDRAGNMWVGTQNGVARYEGGDRFRRYALPVARQNIVRICDAPDNADPTAVVVDNGRECFLLNKASVLGRTPRPHARPPHHYAVLDDTLVLRKPRQLVSAVFEDAAHNLWVGFRNAGYQVISDNQTAFARDNDNALARATAGKDVTTLCVAGRYLLAGTTLRLYCYDTVTGAVGEVFHKNLFRGIGARRAADGSVLDEEPNAIVPHGDGRLWLVGDREIVDCTVSGVRVSPAGIRVSALPGADRLGMGVRRGTSLYVCTNGGYILRLDDGASVPQRIPFASRWYDDETQMTLLAGGDLLLFMKNMHIAILPHGTDTPHELAVTGAPGEAAIDPAFVRQDAYGGVWLGTKRYGLYRLDMRRRSVERMAFLDDVHIQAMVTDRSRRLWISTLKEVACYDPRSGGSLLSSMVSSSQNNINRQFFDNAICLAPDGRVVLGSSDGCHFLNPSVEARPQQGTDLNVYAIEVKTTGDRRLVLNDDIRDGAHYTLAYDEKAVTFRFFYPNYSRRSSLRYQYLLEGYDHAWREPTYRHEGYFANLTPGEYTFRVRLISSPNLPPVAERSVRITMKPAPWRSAAAWLLYLGCAVLLVYFANTLYLRIRTDRIRLEEEHHLRTLLETQLQDMKSLQERLSEGADTASVADSLSEEDRKFMDELYALMEKRARELDLSVATICHDLLISQSKFTYRLKELTGETPGSFVRKYKLNKAARLLREGNHTVSEVAMLTGFGTAAHFSVAFKKQFGMSPSEYAAG